MKKTIVIAEDNDSLCWILTYRLRIDGYDVVFFKNGKKAYDYMVSNHVDLLVTDIKMPIMDGQELIKAVRETISETLPILVISSITEDDFVTKILRLGANAYISKPFQAGELSIRIKHLVYADKHNEIWKSIKN